MIWQCCPSLSFVSVGHTISTPSSARRGSSCCAAAKVPSGVYWRTFISYTTVFSSGCCFGAAVCVHDNAMNAAAIAMIIFFISVFVDYQFYRHKGPQSGAFPHASAKRSGPLCLLHYISARMVAEVAPAAQYEPLYAPMPSASAKPFCARTT